MRTKLSAARRIGGLVVLALLVLVVLGNASAPSARAQAPAIPDVVEDNLDSAAEFYASESGAADLGCSTGCSDLVADYGRAPTKPHDPMPSRFFKSFIDGRIPNPPQLIADAEALTIGLAIADVVVWKYAVLGAHPKDYFIRIPRPAVDPNSVQWRLVNGTNSGWYPTYFDKPDPLPVGIVAFSSDRQAILWHTGTNPASGGPSRCGEPAPAVTPAGVEEFSWIWNACFEGVYDGPNEIDSPLIAHGWKVTTDAFFDPSADPPGNPDSPQVLHGTENPLTRAQIRQRLQDMLASNDPDYAPLAKWFCAVFGGECQNPKDNYPTTPDCTGVTPALCETRFHTAGFTGTITTETLDPDEAVMEAAAGEVTDTSPTSNLQIAQGRDITIYANPTTMPTMTATDTSIASTIKTQNPDTVDDTNKKTIARTCRIRTAAAGKPSSDCTSLPLFVVGKDARTPAKNDLAGLIRNPSWVALNARETKDLTKPAWYLNKAEPSPGCLTAEREPINAECDEYPYWASMQGYQATLNPLGILPNIRWAPQQENTREGNALKQFYSTNGPGPVFPWSGCNILKQPPTDDAPNLASAYLVLPIPKARVINTIGICNRP